MPARAADRQQRQQPGCPKGARLTQRDLHSVSTLPWAYVSSENSAIQRLGGSEASGVLADGQDRFRRLSICRPTAITSRIAIVEHRAGIGNLRAQAVQAKVR